MLRETGNDEYTIPAPGTDSLKRRIDYVFTTGEIGIWEGNVANEIGPPSPSDHRPITAVLHYSPRDTTERTVRMCELSRRLLTVRTNCIPEPVADETAPHAHERGGRCIKQEDYVSPARPDHPETE